MLKQNTLIVFDTSALLGIYKLAPNVRKFYIDCLAQIESSLWFPYTVIFEFHKNRKKLYEESITQIDTLWSSANEQVTIAKDRLSKAIAVISGLAFPEIDEVKNDVLKVLDSIPAKLQDYKMEWPELFAINNSQTKRDSLLDFISNLQPERIGPPLLFDDLYNFSKEADSDRMKGFQAIGGKDNSKLGISKYCDFYIWKEIIRESYNKNKKVILITQDLKDCFIGDDKKFKPDLIKYFCQHTNQEILVYQNLISFLQDVANELKLTIPDLVESGTEENDSLFCNQISDDIISEISNELAISLEDYVDIDSVESYDYDMLENCELEEWELISYEKVYVKDRKAIYKLAFNMTMSAQTREYWTRDDETKENMYSPYSNRSFKGQIDVDVTRELENIIDASDKYKYTYTIGDFIETAFEFWDDAGDICPDCGERKTNRNVGSGSFCRKCEELDYMR